MKTDNVKHITAFKRIVSEFYAHNRRDFPWRRTVNPYRILVSEIMLQQTQTHRVVPKYLTFLKKFPTLRTLAAASLHDVLTEWKGLGYSRRAIALHTIAKTLILKKKPLPRYYEDLLALPSIGPNTASSILAFAYNQPTIFIETNIRTVFIHHFFNDKKNIDDKDIIPLIACALDQAEPREWYYALMDYGVHLKKTVGNLNTKSKHHRRQSAFKGSNREQRSRILECIRAQPRTEKELQVMGGDKEQINANIHALTREGFIRQRRDGKFALQSE